MADAFVNRARATASSSSEPDQRADGENRLGVVVIGRNEGPRLRRCLDALVGSAASLVYVDSGSTDGSAEYAKALGLPVVELDTNTPFTAARARNAGRRQLETLAPGLRYIQFVDGDCTLTPGWLEVASEFLAENDDFAVVAGTLREVRADASVYGLLFQMEWSAPQGETDHCGGIAMIRATAFDSLDGFRDWMSAGEEPELCGRLRLEGWRIMRLDEEMALHDAGVVRFGQWWLRCVRNGHAAVMNWSGAPTVTNSHARRTVLRALAWGAALPALSIAVAVYFAVDQQLLLAGVALLVVPLLMLIQVVRLVLRGLASEQTPRHAAVLAVFVTLSKFPEALGVLQASIHRLRGRHIGLVDHKTSPSQPEARP